MTQAQAAPQPDNATPAKGTGKGKSKASKASKASANGEKKPRAPRVDYGYAPSSIIHMADTEEDPKFSGKRLEYFKLLQKCDGKTVNHFEQKAPKDDAPRGWLRFFCQNGNCTLERVAAAEPAKK